MLTTYQSISHCMSLENTHCQVLYIIMNTSKDVQNKLKPTEKSYGFYVLLVGRYFCTFSLIKKNMLLLKSLWRFMWFVLPQLLSQACNTSWLRTQIQRLENPSRLLKPPELLLMKPILNIWQGNQGQSTRKCQKGLLNYPVKVIHRYPLEKWHGWC